MMKAGISTACFYPQTPEEAVSYLSACRVSNIEIFFNSFFELQKDYLRELRTVLNSGGCKVLSVHPFTSGMEPIFFFSDYVRRVEDGLEMYRRYFAAANEVGAEILVFHGDRRGSNCPEERYFERFFRLYRLGKEFGVTVAQENVERCRSGELSFLRRMKEALGTDAQFVLDVKQARRSGENPMVFLKALGSSICHVHISDGGTSGDCLPIGSGEMDFSAFFEKLREIQYRGGVILELYRQNYREREELISSYDKLREMIG